MSYQVSIFLCFIPSKIKGTSHVVYNIDDCIKMITKNINELLGRVHNSTIDNKLKLDDRLLAHGIALYKSAIEKLTVYSIKFSPYDSVEYKRKRMLHLTENLRNYMFSFTDPYFMEENNRWHFHRDITTNRLYNLDDLVRKVDEVAKLLITAHYGNKHEYDLNGIQSQCDIILNRQYTLWDILPKYYDEERSCVSTTKKIESKYAAVSDNTKRKRLNEAIEAACNVGGDDSTFGQDLIRALQRRFKQIQSSPGYTGVGCGVDPSCGVDISSEGGTVEWNLLSAITNKRVTLSLYNKFILLTHTNHNPCTLGVSHIKRESKCV